MAHPKKRWFNVVRRRKLVLRPSPSPSSTSSPRHIINANANASNIDTIVHHQTPATRTIDQRDQQNIISVPDHDNANQDCAASTSVVPTEVHRDNAAIKIQSAFRGYLTRQAYKTLKSLIKLQGVVRGVMTRREARVASQCMHALARLQLKVRARHLLSQCNQP